MSTFSRFSPLPSPSRHVDSAKLSLSLSEGSGAVSPRSAPGAVSPRSKKKKKKNPLATKKPVGGMLETLPPMTARSNHVQDLTQEEYDSIESVFARMDKDNNGAVSRDELSQALRMSDVPLEEDDIDRVMSALDTDGSGDISLAEFRAREE